MTRLAQAVVGTLCALSACQAYDFFPVQPNAVEVQDHTQTVAAHALAPNIMLVVDRSGSMADDAAGLAPHICDSGNSNSYVGRGPNCKWNNLLDVLVGPDGSTDAGFLDRLDQAFSPNATANDPLRLGLTELPGPSTSSDPTTASCAAGDGSILSSIEPANDAAIVAALLGIAPAGGTPTAATLSVVQGAFPSADPSDGAPRPNYVILMTDGAPNCDSSFVVTSSNCTDDRCALGSCPLSAWGSAACMCGPELPEGCLDEDHTVATVAAMYATGIKTFVIGFGAAAISGASTETLERMGAAGQGGVTITPTSYYQAASSAALKTALEAILNLIMVNPCTFSLEQAPPSQDLIEIVVKPATGPGTTLAQSQFSYDASEAQITITDPLVCGELAASTTTNPYTVEIKYLHQE